jgi:hypothetical protein
MIADIYASKSTEQTWRRRDPLHRPSAQMVARAGAAREIMINPPRRGRFANERPTD